VYRIGIDIGGTFTDVVVARDDGSIVRDKALTTPADYTDGIVAALERAASHAGGSVAEILAGTENIVNGTTVVTNAIAQLKGRKVGLLTTRGFKQQIHIHRGARQIQLDLQKDIPPPEIVRLRTVAEIDERVDKRGNVLVPLDVEQVKAAVRELVEREGIEALAICFLWSFRYLEHERLAGAAVKELYPDMFVTLSSEIYPRIREYERMNTAVLNSFVSEGVESYISRLTERLGAFGLPEGRITFMQSLGGQLSAEEGIREPIQLTHSGPVGGVVAATHLAAQLGLVDVITADVGGTSFDTALIKNQRPTYAHRTRINRLLTGLSTIDIHAIGAGGGSIAWVDERGIPQLGPRSAGADPGPACYGRGGDEPTLTDVNLVLGLIDPHNFWGGTLTLDAEAARRAVGRVAEQIGRSLEETAAGLYEIAVNNMGTAMATVSLARGYDPRDFTVIGYGGAAGLMLAPVCVELGVRSLVVPRAAATFSAYGLLFSDAIRSYATTAEWLIGSGSIGELNDLYDRLEKRAVGALLAQGFGPDEIAVAREADVKFVGQAFEIPTTMPPEAIGEEDRATLQEGFVETYERLYGAGTAWRGFPIQLHTARVVATGSTRKPSLPREDAAEARDGAPAQTGSRTIFLAAQGEVTVSAYDGSSLEPGMELVGPALIDDVDTTLYVPAAVQLAIDPWRNYVFDLEAALTETQHAAEAEVSR
jgi:N-methylhydantoinase A